MLRWLWCLVSKLITHTTDKNVLKSYEDCWTELVILYKRHIILTQHFGGFDWSWIGICKFFRRTFLSLPISQKLLFLVGGQRWPFKTLKFILITEFEISKWIKWSKTKTFFVIVTYLMFVFDNFNVRIINKWEAWFTDVANTCFKRWKCSTVCFCGLILSHCGALWVCKSHVRF